MSKPFVCVICNGSGKVDPEEGSASKAKITCHGCGGKGWIVVPEEAPQPVPFPDKPIPFPYYIPDHEPYPSPFRHRYPSYWGDHYYEPRPSWPRRYRIQCSL